MKDVAVKKLWEGFASVRSTLVQRAVKKREGLRITYQGEVMTIPYEKLLHPLHIGGERLIKSKFGGTYTLCDFRWNPDKPKVAYTSFDRKGNRLL